MGPPTTTHKTYAAPPILEAWNTKKANKELSEVSVVTPYIRCPSQAGISRVLSSVSAGNHTIISSKVCRAPCGYSLQNEHGSAFRVVISTELQQTFIFLSPLAHWLTVLQNNNYNSRLFRGSEHRRLPGFIKERLKILKIFLTLSVIKKKNKNYKTF